MTNVISASVVNQAAIETPIPARKPMNLSATTKPAPGSGERDNDSPANAPPHYGAHCETVIVNFE
jgi:hypothetical protein